MRVMWVFDHLFKTAGTTFHSSYIPAAFAPSERFVLRGFPATNAEDQRTVAALGEAALQQLRIVAGHNAGALRAFFPDARFITVVRDPVDRAVSAYLHAIHHHDAQSALDTGPAGVTPTFQAFVKEDIFAQRYWSVFSVQNGQSRLLLGPDYSALSPEGLRQRLFDRYAVVGHTERFDEFLFYLYVREGLPLCVYNNRLVRGEPERFEPTQADLITARSCNLVDLSMHDIVCGHFEAALQSLTSSERSLRDRYLTTLRAFRMETQGDQNSALRLDRTCSTLWDAARHSYAVFGTFPGFRESALVLERLPLNSISLSKHVEADFAGPEMTITAEGRQWSYAGRRPWPDGAPGVRITLQVETGEIGVAVVHDSEPTRLVAEASVGQTDAPVAVDLWPESDPGLLILRNHRPDRCRVRLLSMDVVRDPTSERTGLVADEPAGHIAG